MEDVKIINIRTDDGEPLANMTIHGPISQDNQKVDDLSRLITNILSGRPFTPVDLGMNSHYARSATDTIIMRFVDKELGGTGRPLFTIVPSETHRKLFTPELGMKIAAAFVRDETPYVPAAPKVGAGRGAPRP